jgi:hypothetical protein
MLRKLNFTDRARIPRSAVQIALRRGDDGILAFDPRLALDALRAPAAARVYIEAWYRSSYMRFDCGTVARFSPPADRRLTEIDSDNVVRFRVKVVDNSAGEHRIVAAADDITIAEKKPDEASRRSLLPVNFCELGDQVWRVTFDANGPVLDLNGSIPNIEVQAKSDARFFALVYPAAVREILTRILLVDDYEPAEESDEWWSLWLRWGAELTDDAVPDEADDREVWIEEVVAAFCGRHQVASRFQVPEADA